MLRKSLADSKTTDLSQARNTALQYNPLEKPMNSCCVFIPKVLFTLSDYFSSLCVLSN